MEQNVMQLIIEGKYTEAEKIAEDHIDDYELDEAEEIYNELYDRIVDEKGRGSEDAARYMRRLAVVNFEKGNYDSSLVLNNAVLEWCSQNNCSDSVFALSTIMDIGEIYSLYNRYEDQYNICRNALDISINTYGENDNMTCKIFKNLADSCVSLFRYDEAMIYYERLLRICESDEKEYVKEIAMVYDGMGYVYRYRGMPMKAKECFEHGIELLEKEFDEDNETLLFMLNDLCNLYNILSMLDEALVLRKSILERTEKLYGFDHPNVCVSKSNLAGAYDYLGEYDKAINLYEECLRWTYESFGEDHCETIRHKICLSTVYRKTGRYDEALQLAQEAYHTRSEILGEDHIDTVLARTEIGYCYVKLKNLRAAKEIFEKTARYFKGKNGDGDDYFYAMEDYLYVCVLIGEYSKALDNADRLLELAKTFSEPAIIYNMVNVKALACKGLGRYSEAVECQKKVIEMVVDKYGENNPETLINKAVLASIFFDMADFEGSIAICVKVASEFDKLGLKTAESYKAKILLSRNYSALGKYDKASEIINMLFEEMDMNAFRAEYSDVCYAAAENYKNMKQYDKALEYAQKALAYRQCIYEENNIETKAAEALCETIKRERK